MWGPCLTLFGLYPLPSCTDTSLVTSITRNLVCLQRGLLQSSGLDSYISAWPPHKILLSQGSSGICSPSTQLREAELQRSSRILSPLTAITIHDQDLLILPLNRYQTWPLLHSNKQCRGSGIIISHLDNFMNSSLMIWFHSYTSSPCPWGSFLGHRFVLATFHVLEPPQNSMSSSVSWGQ